MEIIKNTTIVEFLYLCMKWVMQSDSVTWLMEEN